MKNLVICALAILVFASQPFAQTSDWLRSMQPIETFLGSSKRFSKLGSTGTNNTVFVTSTTFTGSLGGLSGADSACQVRAASAGLTGTYRAWLSTTTSSPAARLVQSTSPYALVNGTVIANNWTDLTDGSLLAPIDRTESGDAVSSSLVWTSTQANGSFGGSGTCSGWTSTVAATAIIGVTSATTSAWTFSGVNNCITPARLYCFLQVSEDPDIQVSGGPLNFGTQAVNVTSSSRSITVQNVGAADLVLGEPAFTTGTQFDFVTNPSGTVLGPTESTTIEFTFKPTSVGAKTDTVTITSNDLDTVPAIVLTGQGVPPISGSVNVGVGETYTSLTNFGGLFEALNTAGLGGNLTVNITSDITGESGTIPLAHTEIGGSGFTITIQPSGAARTITGSVDLNDQQGMIRLLGADRVTFDGSAFGGRSLTIRNTDGTGAASTFFLVEADDITINSCDVRGRSNNDGVIALYVNGNSNTSITDNAISGPARVLIGSLTSTLSFNSGTISDNDFENFNQTAIDLSGSNQDWTVTGNDITLGGADGGPAGFGIRLNSGGTNVVSGNTIYNIDAEGFTGISIGTASSVTTVSGNHIYDFQRLNVGSFTGISVQGTDTTVVNNFVSLTPAAAATVTGINISGLPASGTATVDHNSVHIGGTTIGSASTSAFSVATVGTGGTITARNNIFLNSRTGGTGAHRAASYDETGNISFDYNIYSGTGSTTATDFFNTPGGDVPFATWQAGPPTRDANSQAGTYGTGAFTLGNIFVSATDLHAAFVLTNPALNTGTPILAVTTDFDGDVRSATTPDVGADEFTVPTANLSVEPASVDFGNLIVGSPAVNSSVVITNNGGGSVEITALPITGTNAADFSANAVGGLPATLNNGDSLTVNLTFDPSAPGSRTATLGITSTPATTLTVPLSGSGQANTLPIAVDDTAITSPDQDLVLDDSDLVANDIDPDQQPLTVIQLSNPTNGSVILSAGTISFTPSPGFTGTAGFDYSVSDGIATDIGHVTITVIEPRTLIVDTLEDDPAADECLDAVADDCSLRRAIGTSNDGDTITFDPSIYTVPGVIELAGSDIDIDKSITINGPGAAQLTVSGGDASRVFTITPNSEVVISGLTIAEGFATGSFPANAGGGIYNGEATLTLTNMVVLDNLATGDGGGIYNDSGTVVLNSTTVSLNTSNSGSGGGIASRSTSSLGPTLTVIDSTIANNNAQFGDGGGIFSGSDAVERPATLNVTNSTVSGNIGASGGGISSDPGPDGVTTLNISNSTIAFNTAAGLFASGGGVWNGFGSATASINSTIISDNVLMTSGRDLFSGTPLSGSYNLIENSFGFTFASGSNNIFGVSPLIGPLQDNGGPTLTHAFNLSLGLSPAIDKGSASGLTTDQRGMNRTVDFGSIENATGGDGTDIGAYERMAPTAAPASISGRVMTSSGAGIRGAVVTVQGMDGEIRSVTTNTFGRYEIGGLTAGASYVVTVSSRRYAFANGTQLISLDDNISGLDFTASQ